eukprot:COSAG06_NODE_9175_length_1967_cov_5.091481_2_plen_78_part_00
MLLSAGAKDVDSAAHRQTAREAAAQSAVAAPGNIYATPLRFKLGGHPVLSARFNVETAGSERTQPEIELRRVSKLFL